jgi:acetyltransferase
MRARQRWLDQPDEKPTPLDTIDMTAAQAACRSQNWEELLALYGIPLPSGPVAASEDEAVARAGALGYPVVMKLVSETLTHKSDIGGVRLNLTGEQEIRSAYRAISEASQRAGADMQGVRIQKMLSGGQEVIVGVRRDPQFGAMVLFGTGGVDVELLRDVRSEIAPLTAGQASDMVDATRAGVKLKGWRGQPPADRSAVLDILERMARLAVDLPEIAELEINPLYVLRDGEGAVALDIRGRYAGTAETAPHSVAHS